MHVNDFKKITAEHVDVCRLIIERDGDCSDIPCSICPFNPENHFQSLTCRQYPYIPDGRGKTAIKKYCSDLLDMVEKSWRKNCVTGKVD